MVLSLTFAIAPAAHAAAGSPLDCGAGVVAVKGGYQLTQDVTCGFTWADSHKFLDLRGHTLTGAILTTGDHLTFRNGTLVTDGSYLASDNVTLSHLKVEGSGPVVGFLIEAGNNFVFEHSSFENIDASVVLDFYFGSTARITNSTFTGNTGAAISVQAANDVDIEHNAFNRNGIGVNLWPEDMAGVNRVTVSNNTFDGNVNAALSIHGFIENGALDAAHIERNTITATGGAGIEVVLTCLTGDDCTPPSMSVSHNHLLGNGTA
ncbi:MAG: right-handed parallel beta-helix repeat-containing protein, partial [Mycobacterium sp.]